MPFIDDWNEIAGNKQFCRQPFGIPDNQNEPYRARVRDNIFCKIKEL